MRSTSEDGLASLEFRFAHAQDLYEGLRRECEGAVAQWKWASSPMYDLDPMFFCDPHIKAGHEIGAPRGGRAGLVEYGYCEDGFLAVERRYVAGSEAHYHAFFVSESNCVREYRFDYTPSRHPVNCSELTVGAGGPESFRRWGSRGWVSYRYVCVDGRIKRFQATKAEHGEADERFSGDIRYLDRGQTELWTTWGGNRPELAFRGVLRTENPLICRVDTARTGVRS
jgi:hypothetical protein